MALGCVIKRLIISRNLGSVLGPSIFLTIPLSTAGRRMSGARRGSALGRGACCRSSPSCASATLRATRRTRTRTAPATRRQSAPPRAARPPEPAPPGSESVATLTVCARHEISGPLENHVQRFPSSLYMVTFISKPVFVCMHSENADKNWLENESNHIQGGRESLNMILHR